LSCCSLNAFTSPLAQAVKSFERAGIAGYRLRPLISGVLVVQGPQHSEDKVREDHLQGHGASSCARAGDGSPRRQVSCMAYMASAVLGWAVSQVCARIAELTRPAPKDGDVAAAAGPVATTLGPAITASDVARALGSISLSIAAEHLLLAEARGVLCRDDGPEGLRFFRNFFVQDFGV
jgi:ESCRT-II complex subunit VPS36